MPNPESPGEQLSSSEVLRFFLEKKRREPDFFNKLATVLWNSSTPDERYGIIALQAAEFPDDLVAKKRLAQLSLVTHFLASPEAREYIQNEREELKVLEALFVTPTAVVDELAPTQENVDLPPVS
jgi:hypothetical protein